MTWKLKRLCQCAKCPWKVSTDPHDIPHGYSPEKHKALACTIAEPGAISATRSVVAGLDVLRAMACHESPEGDEAHCVGWLAHQLGPGNNIALRLAVRDCQNVQHIQLDGEQHERFEDTLP